jgi:hypothetical protein
MIQIRKHEIIIIPVFTGTHVPRPILPRSKDFVDCGFRLVEVIVVGAVEVLPAIFRFAVCLPAVGEVEADPSFYFLWFCEVDVAIYIILAINLHIFQSMNLGAE